MQVVQAKLQQITVKEFLPLLGLSERSVRNYCSNKATADISIEWMIAYRFGHDLIPDNVRNCCACAMLHRVDAFACLMLCCSSTGAQCIYVGGTCLRCRNRTWQPARR